MKWLKGFFCKLGRFLSAVRRYTAHVLTLIVLLFVLATIFSGDKTPKVPKNSLLVIKPVGHLTEYEPELDPMDAITNEIMGSAVQTESVYKLVEIVKHAQTDERIQGIVLDLSQLSNNSLNKLDIFKEALIGFKESGKPIYTNADLYSLSQYYLASVANEIYLNPLGGVVLDGFRSESPYFGEALEKLNIKINIFRVGAYKSAVEPFLLTGMSDEARENLAGWLGEQWQQYLTSVAGQRNIDERVLSGKLDDFLAVLKAAQYDTAQMALSAGLVDGLMHRHEYIDYLAEQYGYNKEKDSFNSIKHQDYWLNLPLTNQQPNLLAATEKNHVKIIVAAGEIVDGFGLPDQVGGDRLAHELKKARHDEQVKAVVLRVDSPGGSAFASEIIRQEILELRRAGKPVIASMSSVAASGGYWISAGADKIIAAPSTITGSIGVFGMLPTVDEALAKVGIYYDGVSTTELPSGSTTTPLTEETKIIVQASVDAIYDDFLTLVSEARGMTQEAVHQVAQGQVWSGERALKLGLVDELGDLNVAIKAAAELAEIDKYAVIWPEVERSFTQELLAELGFGAKLKTPNLKQLKEITMPFIFALEYNDPKHVYARCVECKIQ